MAWEPSPWVSIAQLVRSRRFIGRLAKRNFRGWSVTAVLAWGFFDQQHSKVDGRFDPSYGETDALAALDEIVRDAAGPEPAVPGRHCSSTARSGVRGPGDYHHRARSVMHDLVAHGAQEQALEAPQPARSHHDEVGVPGLVDDGAGGVP